MTTVIHRSTGNHHGLFTTGRAFTQFSSFMHSLAGRWQRWQTEREIESMPFDIRKDIGWPSADIEKNHMRMQ